MWTLLRECLIPGLFYAWKVGELRDCTESQLFLYDRLCLQVKKTGGNSRVLYDLNRGRRPVVRVIVVAGAGPFLGLAHLEARVFPRC